MKKFLNWVPALLVVALCWWWCGCCCCCCGIAQKRLFGRWPESLVERTCNFRSGGWLVGWAACRPRLHREEVREGAGATRKWAYVMTFIRLWSFGASFRASKVKIFAAWKLWSLGALVLTAFEIESSLGGALEFRASELWSLRDTTRALFQASKQAQKLSISKASKLWSSSQNNILMNWKINANGYLCMCVPPFLKSYLPPYDCNKYHYDDGIAWHWQSSMSRIAPIRAAAAAAVVVAALLLLQLRSHGKTATVLAAGQIRQKSNTAGKNPTNIQ